MKLHLLALFIIVTIVAVLGQDVELETPRGSSGDESESPYFHAARIGDLDTVLEEIESRHDINIKNNDGWTPLHFACDTYQPHIILTLLRNGADINAQDNDGWTCLMFAAHAGNTMLVTVMFENGADPLLANKDGFGAHSIAEFEGHTHIAATIAVEGMKAAIAASDLPTMMMFIRDGAPVNTRNAAGWTPLIACITAGEEGFVAELLDVPGIDVNMAENDGWTPLMFAANNNRVQSAQWLIERGADVEVQSRQGLGAKGIARDRDHKEVSALIKRAKALRNRFRTEQEAAQARLQPVDPQAQAQQEQSNADYTAPAVSAAPQAKVPEEKVKVKVSVKKSEEPAPKKAGWLW